MLWLYSSIVFPKIQYIYIKFLLCTSAVFIDLFSNNRAFKSSDFTPIIDSNCAYSCFEHPILKLSMIQLILIII